MKKICFIIVMLFFAMQFSEYAFASDIYRSVRLQDVLPEVTVNTEDLIPEALDSFLLEKNIDLSALTAFEVQRDGNRLIIFKEGEEAKPSLLMFVNNDGDGMLFMIQNPRQGSAVRFNMEGNLFSVQELSEDCIRQISVTLQSLISTIYACAIVPNPLSCTIDMIDLATNLYFLRIDCPGEE